MIKLLVSDFDNTFFDNNYYQNIKAVNNFVNQGNIFIIATGRHIQKLLNDIKDYDLKYNYIICNDGGIIFDNNLNVIYQKDIPTSLIKPIVNLFKNDANIDYWYIDTGLSITTKINNLANGLIAHFKSKEKAFILLNKLINNYKSIHGYISDYHINITEKTVTKQKGIELIAKKLKIKEKNIYTIGDNINDISMSIYNSYCMENSNSQLKKCCLGEYKAVYELINDLLSEKL